MVPSLRAEALRGPLRRLLRDLEGLLHAQAVFEPATAENTFRLGGTDHVHAMLSGGLVSQLRRLAPGIRLAMMPFQSGRAWQDLESGRLDATIVTSFVTLNDAKARPLLQERFVFAQRKGHPRGPTPPDLDAFCDLDHLLISPEGGGFVGAVDQALEELGRVRRVQVSLPSFLLAAPVIETSDLVCVFPERLARVCGGNLDIFPLPFQLDGFGLQMVWHPRSHNDPAQVWFRNAVVDYVRQTPGLAR